MATRITVVHLRSCVDTINDALGRYGVPKRLECGGRNGYQAVDQYSVDADGSRKNSGVDCNVCCGSSRECVDGAWQQYNALMRYAGQIA